MLELEQVQEVIDKMTFPAGMSVIISTDQELGFQTDALVLWVIQELPHNPNSSVTVYRHDPVPDFTMTFTGEELKHAIALLILDKLIDKTVCEVRDSTYYEGQLVNGFHHSEKDKPQC